MTTPSNQGDVQLPPELRTLLAKHLTAIESQAHAMAITAKVATKLELPNLVAICELHSNEILTLLRGIRFLFTIPSEEESNDTEKSE